MARLQPLMQTGPAVEVATAADDRLVAGEQTDVAVEVLRIVVGAGGKRTRRLCVCEVVGRAGARS